MTKLLLTFFFVLSFVLPLFAQSVDTAWVRTCDNRVSALAIDGTGNVYVTGLSLGSVTSATIKYKSNGDTAWVRSYIGQNFSPSIGQVEHTIAVDGSGNVYVTGGAATSDTSDAYATRKYYPNGDTAWVRRYNGPGKNNTSCAIAVDDSGNVYVTGYSVGNGTSTDYATVKYKPNGDTAWVRRYNGPGNSEDEAVDMAIDGIGNVYVTGWSYGSGTEYDYATIKYKSNGDTAWVRRYNGFGNSQDISEAIAIDGSGNVYVTGGGGGDGSSLDYTTIKYYPNGDTSWVRRYNGPGNSVDEAWAIGVDGSGYVYVTGFTIGNGTYTDYTTVKYYPSGDTVWVRSYNGPGNYTDYATAVAVDTSGNVYVTGYSEGSGTLWDYATIKYKPNGDTVWVRRYNAPENFQDQASAIAVDGWGNVYVTGTDATIKYVQFLRGDANSDKKVTVSDIVFLVSYLFKHGPAPAPIQSGDANCDGKVTIADIVYLVAYLFKHGPVPCI